ncbi:hypothetical protein A2U01_0016284 [Trifolium medium]|uniref:Uncharacterized protein n=1 Tax=Trifolium medium TaxID=97028 RepID=A0A392N7Z8_9FABA|nr:hypothetical protein [Trifolium medium]
MENEGVETDSPSLNAQILYNFPYRRAAPCALRDAQLSVTQENLNFVPARRAKPYCATRNCQRIFLV